MTWNKIIKANWWSRELYPKKLFIGTPVGYWPRRGGSMGAARVTLKLHKTQMMNNCTFLFFVPHHRKISSGEKMISWLTTDNFVFERTRTLKTSEGWHWGLGEPICVLFCVVLRVFCGRVWKNLELDPSLAYHHRGCMCLWHARWADWCVC